MIALSPDFATERNRCGFRAERIASIAIWKLPLVPFLNPTGMLSPEASSRCSWHSVVRAPIAGTILQVNVRAGENVSTAATTASIVLGDIDEVQVRADVDEQVAPRVKPGARAVGYLKGDSARPIAMEFVRIEPFVVPKRSLTGASIERVDTRVLQVIYRFPNSRTQTVYVGQQLDLFIEE